MITEYPYKKIEKSGFNVLATRPRIYKFAGAKLRLCLRRKVLDIHHRGKLFFIIPITTPLAVGIR